MSVIENRYDFIRRAMYNLGIERIRKLNYNTTLIKRELVKVSDKPQVKKIIELLVQKIGYHNPISCDLAKSHLQEVYDILGIDITATAPKLGRYFKVKAFAKNSDRMIELIREKNILTNLE